MRDVELAFVFVDAIPRELDRGTLYISIPFATVLHSCCCGCGREVVTPLSPTGWTLSYDGDSVSLDPSIGNWSFPCQSHYWIRRNRVEWAERWSRQRINDARKSGRMRQDVYFDQERNVPRAQNQGVSEGRFTIFWQKLKQLLLSS